MTPPEPTRSTELDPVVGAWLRTLPDVPPTFVGDLMRRVPQTPQRRRRWSIQRLLHQARLPRPVLASVRVVALAAFVLVAVLAVRVTWPMSRVDQLAAQHGLVLTTTVEPSVVQVLRDDAGHDLTATWPDHPRDIDHLAEGPDGAVWIGWSAHDTDNTLLQGAQVWRLGEPGLWGIDQGLPWEVADLAIGPDGTLWVAGDGLSAFREGRWLPTGPASEGASLSIVEPSADGSVWAAGTWDAPQLWELDAGRWRDHAAGASLRRSIGVNRIQAIATTPDGSTWVGLFAGGGGGAGLLRSVGDGWQLVRPLGTEGEDASHDVFALATGPDGSLYAFLDSPFYGTDTDYRLARWDGVSWRSWTSADGFPADASPWVSARSIMRVAPDGAVWLTHEHGGLVRFQRGAATHYLDRIAVNDFGIAGDGTVWVAAERGADGTGGLYAILP